MMYSEKDTEWTSYVFNSVNLDLENENHKVVVLKLIEHVEMKKPILKNTIDYLKATCIYTHINKQCDTTYDFEMRFKINGKGHLFKRGVSWKKIYNIDLFSCCLNILLKLSKEQETKVVIYTYTCTHIPAHIHT